MHIQSVEVKGGLYFYVIVDNTGQERILEAWHPVGMSKEEREREALEYAEKLFAE